MQGWDDGVWQIVLPRGLELERLTRSSSASAGLAQRARIVAQAGVSVPTVLKWRCRFAGKGLAGLSDEARSGRPRQVDRAKAIATTLRPPPKKYGVTHWSTRLLATHLGIGDATVAAIWREVGIQPWRATSFRFSTDPELVAKVTDVVGLYLAPPQNAVVRCVDENSQIQALDRTAPVLPTQPHRIVRGETLPPTTEPPWSAVRDRRPDEQPRRSREVASRWRGARLIGGAPRLPRRPGATTHFLESLPVCAEGVAPGAGPVGTTGSWPAGVLGVMYPPFSWIDGSGYGRAGSLIGRFSVMPSSPKTR